MIVPCPQTVVQGVCLGKRKRTAMPASPDVLPTLKGGVPTLGDVAAVLTRTATLCGQLDQQLHGHPLRVVILFRARLEAARNCAAVDGFLVDPWHLAAVLEGLRQGFVARISLNGAARSMRFTQPSNSISGWHGPRACNGTRSSRQRMLSNPLTGPWGRCWAGHWLSASG